MAVTGENTEDICKSVAWLGNEDIVTGGHSAVIKHTLNPKFLSYYFQSDHFFQEKKKLAHGTKVIEVTPSDLEDVMIPVPSMDVQHAIVEILDGFAIYGNILESQLSMRTAQLNYMRGILFGAASSESLKTGFLAHYESILEGSDIEFMRVDDLFNIRNGYTPSKSESSYWSGGTIPWFVMDDLRQSGSVLADSHQHITIDAVKGNLFESNSIIVSTSATIGYHALITVPFLCNQRFTCLTVKDEFKAKVNVKYLYHYMYVIDDWCKSNTFQSSFQAVDMDNLKALYIPIPCKMVQDKLVELFDSMSALIDNLVDEISARDLQYTYYRDLILQFGGAKA